MTTIPQKTAISKAFNAGAPMIGPTIKAARQARGLTLAEVGGALGVTRQYVYAWESGRRNPGPKHLAKLAEVLGLQVTDLLPKR